MNNNPLFNLHQLPNAYFSDNKVGNELRQQLVRNITAVSECNIKDLEKTFFSKENIDLINKQIIMGVYNKSNKQFLIPNQKEESLLIVMRYVFFEYAKHIPYDIRGQIKELNCHVVKEVLPNIITNLDQKIGYLRDINTQPIGPPLPISTSSTNRTLPSISNKIHNE